MNKERDYIRDIAEIRSMMERSSKFLSLAGWAGIMAGIYAIAGACTAYWFLDFKPEKIPCNAQLPDGWLSGLMPLLLLAAAVLILAISTAIYLSNKKAAKKGEKLWSTTSKMLVANMAVPLVTGGVLILAFISKGNTGMMAPLSLIFYGLALYNAGKFTYEEVKALGVIQICLGLTGAFFTEYGLILWAAGFGIAHIFYGIYMHSKYER